ncbi:biotin--[acetyl-CoA-carboxylase] ligase [Neisseria sp. Ec49-e6-T10]|uniref:biotin--[acetyl-CoA-carboxylase] ligase n=1 Tax=Neisseria sp. Ec49-e6-T10 TaxID=3140744 RepID=UPI003EC0EF3D
MTDFKRLQALLRNEPTINLKKAAELLALPYEKVLSLYYLAKHPSKTEAFFDADKINQKMSYTPIEVSVLPECVSTNQYLLDLAKNKQLNHGQAVLTNRQTGGKGRQGKHWSTSTGGSLPLSLAWHFQKPQQQLSALPLVVALSTWQVLTALNIPAQIKWPNDLMVEQAKMGGILVESLALLTGTMAIIGIGLNLLAPTIEDRTTLGIWDFAPQCQANNLASYLLLALNQSVTQFEQEGFEPFKTAYLNANRDHNKNVTLWQNGQILAQGLMLGVNNDGALLLQTSQGERYFTSGQVSLRSESSE